MKILHEVKCQFNKQFSTDIREKALKIPLKEIKEEFMLLLFYSYQNTFGAIFKHLLHSKIFNMKVFVIFIRNLFVFFLRILLSLIV